MKSNAHPHFWWLWAIALVIALIRLDSIIITTTAIASLIFLSRALSLPQHRRKLFDFTLSLATVAVAIRMFAAILIGVPMPGERLFTLPQIQLPEFLVGVRLGGPVTIDRMAGALGEALLFAALVLAFGLANAASTPTRLLRTLPSRLYGVGVAATLAATITPQIARSIARIRSAQHLRGQPSGAGSWRRITTPVLEDSLERSIDLAAALEARGYGRSPNRTRYRPELWQRTDTVGLIAVSYLALFAPALSLPTHLGALVVAAFTITPAVIQ